MSAPTKTEKDALIQETIYYGNAGHVMIENQKISEALTYILNREESIGWVDRVIINYRVLCSRIEEKLDTIHYAAGKGVHFLIKLLLEIDKWDFPETGSILCSTKDEFKQHIISSYMTCSNNDVISITKIPVSKHIPNGTKLGIFILPLYNKTEFIPGLDYLKGEIEPDSIHLKTNPNLMACMFSDCYSLLPYFTSEMRANLVLRLVHLDGVAPFYFAKLRAVLKPKLIKHRDMFSVDEIITLTRIGFTLIEGFEPDELRKLSPGAWRLACISNKWTLGYYLGFDPRHGEVPFSCIKKAILRLSEVGPVSYVAEVLPKEWRHPFDTPTAGACAEVDIMLNRICDYNPFDIVRYYEDGSSWIVTRPSFENILTTQENPFTRAKIPEYALEEIRRRLHLVTTHNLPVASSLTEILRAYESKSEAEQPSLEGEDIPAEHKDSGIRPPVFDQLIPPTASSPAHLAMQLGHMMSGLTHASGVNSSAHEDFINIANAMLTMGGFSGTIH